MTNVRRFEELLRSDEGLRARLRAAADAHGGDGEDGRAFFDAVIAPLAAEIGLPFTFEEAKGYAEEEGASLDLDDLDAVAGGFVVVAKRKVV